MATQTGRGTMLYVRRASGTTAARTTRNGTVPGKVERIGPTRIQVLSQALRMDFSSVLMGWFVASEKTPSRRLAGPKYERPSASRQFSVGSARKAGVSHESGVLSRNVCAV